jgi:colanic acid biosynthesis glycosyl transferase WcaI
MKIVVLSRHYYPELTGIGPYTAELCEYLVQKGVDVTVITTFPYYPHWYIPKEYKGKWFVKEKRKGVNILRTYMLISQRKGLRQIFHEFFFPVVSLFVGLRFSKHCDIILSVSPPLTTGLTAYLLSLTKKTPFIFHIQDLLPDTAVNLGMLKQGKIVQALYRLEKFIYNKAKAITVISMGFAENLYNKKVPRHKVHYLPNWVDLDFIKPVERDNVFRAKNDLSNETFLVMYAGNISYKQGLETLLDAAFVLKEYTNIAFFIVGDGTLKPSLEEKANSMKLPNLRFLPLQPKEILPYMFSAADVLVITQKASIVDVVLPSKLLTYMASATPVVASVNSNSETARIISQAKSGLIVEPENAEALMKAILHLCSSSVLREGYGNNGRSYVSENFEKSEILEKFLELISTVAK